MTIQFQDILSHISTVLKQHFGEPQGNRYVLGVSGGPDSMLLLYAMYSLELPVLVVHVDYGMRGEESDKDRELVEQMAFQWGYECCTVAAGACPDGENFQNWARTFRYDVFEALRNEQQAAAILTAHHKDDQVETILQKILRGSSPGAWQGMQIWADPVFRPLLSFSKKEIVQCCDEKAIPYRTDASNEESGYARNFIRNELSGRLDEFFPGWDQNILKLPEMANWYRQSVEYIADEVMEGNRIILNKMQKVPVDLHSAVLKYIFEEKTERPGPSAGALHELTVLFTKEFQTGKSIQDSGLLFTRNRDAVIIEKAQGDSGTAQLQRNGGMKTEITEALIRANGGWQGQGMSLNYTSEIKDTGPLYLNPTEVSWPVVLRSWEDGDRFQPFGMEGHQKVSDHLTNRKISAHKKGKSLVLCGSDGTIYAIIYPEADRAGRRGAVSEKVRCHKSTSNYLTINFN